MNVLEVKKVSKKYRIYKRRRILGRDIFAGWLRRKNYQEIQALEAIDFSVARGEMVGIIGENGAGKTTLLKVLAGITQPTEGNIFLRGRVASLLELGAGFHPDLSGRENIYLNGSLLGLTRKQVNQRLEKIIDFSGIRGFLESPVRTYSSGMFLRLGFAIAVNTPADIFLIDEGLAVGDEAFQKKCIKKIKGLKKQGKTIIFVSHDLEKIFEMCERTLLLEEGKITRDGYPAETVGYYLDNIKKAPGQAVLQNKLSAITFNNGSLSLSFANKTLTAANGIHTVLQTKEKRYSSLEAQWNVSQEGKQNFKAEGVFALLGLVQVWEVELNGSEIKLKITISAKRAARIVDFYVQAMLRDDYKTWAAADSKGVFSGFSPSNQKWVSFLDWNITGNSIEAAGKPRGAKIPVFSFKKNDSAGTCALQVYNSDFASHCRVLQYKVIRLSNYNQAGGSNIDAFSGKITIGGSISIE